MLIITCGTVRSTCFGVYEIWFKKLTKSLYCLGSYNEHTLELEWHCGICTLVMRIVTVTLLH